MQVKTKMLVLIISILALAGLGIFVFATPMGPESIARGPDERRSNAAPTEVQAQAGNVTALNIEAIRVTNRWQGYYGNVTGTITLDDAFNNTLYSWSMTNPSGEIYASNSSVTPSWEDVYCFNFSNNKSAGQPVVQRFNGTDVERTLGMNPTDADGIDETFNRTFAGSFQIGSNTIDSTSGCSLVTLYVNDAYQEVSYQETLLTDNSSIIYTALLEPDATGFSGTNLDFQLLVGENGDTATATPYYFYLELT